MYSRFEDDIPQRTADSVSKGLVREVVVLVIPLQVHKGSSSGISVVQIVVDHIVAQISGQSSRKDHSRAQENEAKRRVYDRGEQCTRKRRKHQPHWIEGHLVVKSVDHKVEGAYPTSAVAVQFHVKHPAVE